jgi:hypothetical protein
MGTSGPAAARTVRPQAAHTGAEIENLSRRYGGHRQNLKEPAGTQNFTDLLRRYITGLHRPSTLRAISSPEGGARSER